MDCSGVSKVLPSSPQDRIKSRSRATYHPGPITRGLQMSRPPKKLLPRGPVQEPVPAAVAVITGLLFTATKNNLTVSRKKPLPHLSSLKPACTISQQVDHAERDSHRPSKAPCIRPPTPQLRRTERTKLVLLFCAFYRLARRAWTRSRG